LRLDGIAVDVIQAPKPVSRIMRYELARPENAESWRRQGANTKVMQPDEFGRHIEAEIVRWGKLIRANGIQFNWLDPRWGGAGQAGRFVKARAEPPASDRCR
jgi:hypothetical protein